MKPFELNHIREYGDGTAMYEATFNEPMTVDALIKYALSHRGEWGAIHIHGFVKLEYRYGKIEKDLIFPEQKTRTIKKMTWHGGYSRADYYIKL